MPQVIELEVVEAPAVEELSLDVLAQVGGGACPGMTL